MATKQKHSKAHAAPKDTIKWKIHEYLGSDSLNDCWSEVEPLIDKALAEAEERVRLDEAEWWNDMQGEASSAPSERLEQLRAAAQRKSVTLVSSTRVAKPERNVNPLGY